MLKVIGKGIYIDIELEHLVQKHEKKLQEQLDKYRCLIGKKATRKANYFSSFTREGIIEKIMYFTNDDVLIKFRYKSNGGFDTILYHRDLI